MLRNHLRSFTQPDSRRSSTLRDPTRNRHLDATLYRAHLAQIPLGKNRSSNDITTHKPSQRQFQERERAVQIHANLRKQRRRNGLLEPASARSSLDHHGPSRRTGTRTRTTKEIPQRTRRPQPPRRLRHARIRKARTHRLLQPLLPRPLPLVGHLALRNHDPPQIP